MLVWCVQLHQNSSASVPSSASLRCWDCCGGRLCGRRAWARAAWIPVLLSAGCLWVSDGGNSRWGAPGAGAARLPTGTGDLGSCWGSACAESRAKGCPEQAEQRAEHTEPRAWGWGRYLQKAGLETSSLRLPDCAGNASSSMAWFVLVSKAFTLTEPELREKGN